MKSRLLKRRSALGLGLATLSALNFKDTAKAANQHSRRHLINIHNWGGTDTAWSFSPFLESDANLIKSGDPVKMFYGYYKGKPGQKFNPEATGNAVRFPDEDAYVWDGKVLGPLVPLIFKENELEKMFIWRGVKQEGGHGGGNGILQNGHRSPYAIGFSQLIAHQTALSPGYPRYLHYVQACSKTGDVYVQNIMYKGAYKSINIQDSNIWKSLTKKHKDDIFLNLNFRSLIENFMQDISIQANSKFKIPESKSNTNGFYQSFLSTQEMLSQNYAQNPEWGFDALFQYYKERITEDYINCSQYLPIQMTLASERNLGKYIKVGEPTSESNAKKAMGSYLDFVAFRFALAEFLVVNDLSAVVDIQLAGTDHHRNNSRDIHKHIINMSALNTLMKNLNNVTHQGASLMDKTLITVGTEFDRSIARGLENPMGPDVGAGHGPTNSFLLAGLGVNGGKVCGHRMNAKTGDLSHIENVSFGRAVPLDLKTGQPSNEGHVFSNYSLMPTIAAIFDISIPMQQVVGEPVFDYARKS